jgi:hypothetical protein
MKIIKIDSYLDGGTIEITTNKGSYCIDDRLFSKTKGSIFCNYPKDDNRNIAPNQDELKVELIDALAKYTVSDDDFNWLPRTKELLNVL